MRASVRSQIAVAVVGLYAWHSAKAQVPRGVQVAHPTWADSDAASIMRRGTNRTVPADVVLEVMRQTTTAASTTTRRALSDSLVARATKSPASLDDAIASQGVVNVIGASGKVDPGLGGTPDRAALDALIAVLQQTKAGPPRTMALVMLSQQINPTRALPFLKSMALSPTDDAGGLAIDAIADISQQKRLSSAERDEAVSVLRGLWDTSTSVPPKARTHLCRYASGAGWRRFLSDQNRCGID